MSKAFSKIYNRKSRYISLRHEYIVQLIYDGIITIMRVRSCNNLTYPFTKGLSRDLVRNTSTSMRLKTIYLKLLISGTQLLLVKTMNI
jgi:hypothetical protein